MRGNGGSAAFDVVVAGLGVMGSAACWQLARRGLRVLGLDRFHPPHTMGSSHGGTRVIREMAFEHPRYVPLVRRAYTLWDGLAAETARQDLLIPTGAVYLGAPGSSVVAGSRRSAIEHDVPSEELDAGAVRRRWPQFAPAADMIGLLEHRAGILRPEQCVQAMLDAASARGAELAFDEPVIEWDASASGGPRVRTTRRTVSAERLVIATGPWIQNALVPLGVPLWIERVVQHWFSPARHGERFEPDRCPIYLWEDEAGVIFYGFPLVDGALKCAIHHRGETVSADTVRRDVSAEEVARARSYLSRFLPDAAGPHLRSAVCLYTNTPDGDFIIDRHPAHDSVVLASPCSGVGFKFAPAIGSLVADLLTDSVPDFDLSPFSLARFRQ